MANRIAGNRLPKWSTRELTPGVRVDSGPFIGVVKNNSDPARLGRLQVWLPDLGGTEYDPNNWYTVSYASPFFGSTLGRPEYQTTGAPFGYESQTYGFWAVPPDIENFVLVTFVMGDPSRGYWFACVPNTQATHMLPAISRPVNPTVSIADSPGIKGRVDTKTDFLPVTEVNTNNVEQSKSPTFVTDPKRVHPFQANIVLEQGLETDPLRGSVTSSAQRETPSQVFGISTPGRHVEDPAESPDLGEKLKYGKLTVGDLQNLSSRRGGHSFVMDDGDIYGKDNLVRLRTAGGHTILMSDTDDIFYVINKNGSAWVELTRDGSINVFSNQDLNIRAARDLNFHADANVNIHSGDTLKFYAEKNILAETNVCNITATKDFQLNAGKVGVLSDTAISLQSTTGNWLTSGDLILKGRKIYQNAKAPQKPTKNPPFEFYQQPNVEYDAEKKKWKKATEKFTSISPVSPTHEPWQRQTGELKLSNGKVVAAKEQTPKVKK